jgi:hypothetical protein
MFILCRQPLILILVLLVLVLVLVLVMLVLLILVLVLVLLRPLLNQLPLQDFLLLLLRPKLFLCFSLLRLWYKKQKCNSAIMRRRKC